MLMSMIQSLLTNKVLSFNQGKLFHFTIFERFSKIQALCYIANCFNDNTEIAVRKLAHFRVAVIIGSLLDICALGAQTKESQTKESQT